MSSGLYLPSGYLAVDRLRSTAPPFSLITGGRGTGKTYGFLESYRLTDPAPFILMRRTQEQVNMLSLPDFDPFREIDADHGIITINKKMGGRISAFYNGVMDGAEARPDGAPIGYAMALSTIHNIRGFSAAQVQAIIFDEFIPERQERWIPDEFNAFLNAYETINRNRELKGEPPVKMFCLSNSNTLANPYFIGLKIVERVDRMRSSGTEIWEDQKRGLRIVAMEDSPISELKSQTALYKLASDTDYAEMAIKNKFANEARSRTGSWPLRELIPLVSIGELCLYRHKSRRELYGSTHKSGNPVVYGTTDADVARFQAKFGWTWELYLDDKIVWQHYTPEILYRRFMGERY